jgi:outer membrane lipoprotein-sorting protein
MSDFPQDELVRRLEALGAVQASPEATVRALERVRQALTENHVIKFPPRKKFGMLPLVAAAAALMLAASLSSWLWVNSASAASAKFQAVQAAMKAAATVKCTLTTRIQGQQGEETSQLFMRNGRWRADRNDGKYTVVDASKDRALLVNRQKQEAVLQGANVPQVNLYEVVKNLPSNTAASSIAEEGSFAVEVEGRPLIVKADANTRLPVKIQGEVIDNDGGIVECVLDDFAYDTLDDDLFVLEPPPGFKLEKRGVARLGDLVVTPLVGIGTVKFGMSRQEMEKLFGPPDADTEITDSQGDNVMALSYAPQGFAVAVSKTRGVVSISCFKAPGTPGKIRDFTGKTDAGIALGASAADIIQAYGEPNVQQTQNGLTTMRYDELQAEFWLSSDRKLFLIAVFHQ